MIDTEATSKERHDSLAVRGESILSLFASGAVDAPTAFGMLFFHGIKTAVKNLSQGPQARAACDAIKEALRVRTEMRARAHAHGAQRGAEPPALDEAVWGERELQVDPTSAAGFVMLVEAAARNASAATGIEPTAGVYTALLAFVRMETSVHQVAESGEEWALGGYPDSVHFFSFAELGFWKLEHDPRNAFWLSLTRGAVAAQPIYLALHFLAGRRPPRAAGDYGPSDLLARPKELARRLSTAPDAEDLSAATCSELEALAGRNAWLGFCQ